MKKIIALLLAAIMVLGLAACASKTEPADRYSPLPSTAADTGGNHTERDPRCRGRDPGR